MASRCQRIRRNSKLRLVPFETPVVAGRAIFQRQTNSNFFGHDFDCTIKVRRYYDLRSHQLINAKDGNASTPFGIYALHFPWAAVGGLFDNSPLRLRNRTKVESAYQLKGPVPIIHPNFHVHAGQGKVEAYANVRYAAHFRQGSDHFRERPFQDKVHCSNDRTYRGMYCRIFGSSWRGLKGFGTQSSQPAARAFVSSPLSA
jgi:hypothetical protein